MNILRRLFWIVIFLQTLPSFAQFTQIGVVREYNRREKKSVYSRPVEIQTRGAQSIVSDVNGAFSLHFIQGHAGDTLSRFRAIPSDPKYTLFNLDRLSDWVLTPNRDMEIVVCKKSILDEIERKYTQNYVSTLIRHFKKQEADIEKRLLNERANHDALKVQLQQARDQFKADSLNIIANAVVFSHVDESELDSLELEWRECVLRGDNTEAVRIGNEMDLQSVSSSRLENLNRSVLTTRDMLDKTYQTAVVLEQHIRNLEDEEMRISGSLFFLATTKYLEDNGAYYESLVSLYQRLYELYTTEIRCSEDHLSDIKRRYSESMYRCVEVHEYNLLLGYSDRSNDLLKKSASLDNYKALVVLANHEKDYLTKKNYIKKARKINDCVESKSMDRSLIDFAEIVEQDTLYFHILDSETEKLKFGDNAVMLCDVHLRHNNVKQFRVPAKIIHTSVRYDVKIIGPRTFELQIGLIEGLFRRSKAYIWPEAINHNVQCCHKFKASQIIVPNGVQEIDEYAFNDSVHEIKLPVTLSCISGTSIPIGHNIKIRFTNNQFLYIKSGTLYSKESGQIISFLSDDIKEIYVNDSLKFNTSFFSQFSKAQFPKSLERFVVSERNPYYKSVDGVLIDKSKDSLLVIPNAKNEILLSNSMIPLSQPANYFHNRSRYLKVQRHTPEKCTFRIPIDGTAWSKNEQADFFFSQFYEYHERIDVKIGEDVVPIDEYLEQLLPNLGEEQLTFWGRALAEMECLHCLEMGVKIFDTLKSKYNPPYYTNEVFDKNGVLIHRRDSLHCSYAEYNNRMCGGLEYVSAIDTMFDYSNFILPYYDNLGMYDKIVSMADNELANDSTNYNMQLWKSKALFNNGLFDRAIDEISSYIARKKEEGIGYYYRAFYEENLGMLNDALQDYSRAIALGLGYTYLFCGRGDVYTRLGANEKARDDYKKVLTKLSLTNSRYVQMAHYMLGNVEKALSLLGTSLKTYPDNPETYFNAACLAGRMGNDKEALDYLKTALQKGFKRIVLIRLSDDLKGVRDLPEYKGLLEEVVE